MSQRVLAPTYCFSALFTYGQLELLGNPQAEH